MFPRDFIESHLKNYSSEEQAKIKKDLAIVKQLYFDSAIANQDSTPVYLATAGGPGSGKNTALEAYLIANQLDHYVYVDTDQVTLKNMNFTYRRSLTNYDYAIAPSNLAALRAAYDKWRAASNYITHELMQIAFGNDDGKGEKYSIAHGTTSTSPNIGLLYRDAKSFGYRITLLLCYSQDETRKRFVETREKEQAFVQTLPADVISKGADFPRRFNLYFQYADEMFFYWNDELTHGKLPIACAHYVKDSNGVKLEVLNESDWNSFCSQYLRDIKQYGIEICESFAAFIPDKLLDVPKVSAQALPAMGLYAASSAGATPVVDATNETKATP
jgi:hypothetical protein